MSKEVHSPLAILVPRTQPNHAATIQDIDDALDGKLKAPVRVVATTNQAGTYDPATMTLTYGANGALVIDGVPLSAGDRLLATAQATGTENGIFVVEETGDASNPAKIVRSPDFNASEKILSGVRINVDAGTQFSDTTWKLTTTGTIILDMTVLDFIKASVSQGAAKFATTITGDGLETDFNIEHDLGTTDVSVTVRNVTTNLEVIVDWKPVDGNNIEILFAVAPLNTNSFRVVVIG